VFEDHKAKKAAEAHERALADWQSQRDGYADLLDVVQHFPGTTADTIILGSGEAVFYKVTGASLIEERRGAGHYAGHSQGISIPIAHVAGRPIRYRVGVNKGHFVQGTPTPTAIDTGTVYLTNKRVIFQGTKQTRECAFTKLIGYEGDDGDGSTTFSVSNRQKPTTIHYGPSLSDTFDFRLDLALAHFRRDVSPLVEQLQAKLAELDAHRPPDLALPPPGPVPGTEPADAPARGDGDLRPGPAAPMVEGPPPARAPATADAPSAPVAGGLPEKAASTPAGWYADPWGMTPLRWWDGSAWTGYVNMGHADPGAQP
jgi:hypothetical protein